MYNDSFNQSYCNNRFFFNFSKLFSIFFLARTRYGKNIFLEMYQVPLKFVYSLQLININNNFNNSNFM